MKLTCLIGVSAMMALMPAAVAAEGAQQGKDGTGPLAWVTVASAADLETLKTRLEREGGKVLELAPEGRLLVRLPDGDVGTAFPDAQLLDTPPVSARGGEPSGRGLGERPPTPEEQAIIDKEVVSVSRIEPNSLSKLRASFRGERDLPSAVDNSVSTYFPPIRSQGSQGSCVAWAVAYYYNTYTQASDEDLAVSGGDNDHICSPAFQYPLINGGSDNGANTSSAMYYLNQVGCSSWSLKPYSQSDYYTWPSETAWVDALKRRTQQSYSIYTSSDPDAQMQVIKQHLANGYIAATRTDVYSTWYYDYPDDAGGIDNAVLYASDGSLLGGHAMTIVGYDDNRTYFDGATTRTGAMLIANSWGSNWGTRNTAGNRGYMWVGYDYFKDTPSCFGRAYYNSDRPVYRPRLYAVSGLNHSQRGYVRYSGGVGDASSPDWSSYYPISYRGGTSRAVTDADRVAVDLTDGVPDIADRANAQLFARMYVSGSASESGTITSAEFFHDIYGTGTYQSALSPDPTVTVDPGASDYATVVLDVHDGIVPASCAHQVSDPTIASATVPISYTASDEGGSGLTSVSLWVKGPGAPGFSDTGLVETVTSGTFTYPVPADGCYEFCTRATDGEGNVEAAPASADCIAWVNTEANTSFAQTAETGNDALVFPMTDDLDATVTLSGASAGGEITVTRTVPGSPPPAFRLPGKLLSEQLSITGSGLGSFTATLEWSFDPASAGGLGPDPINRVFRVVGGSVEESYPATVSGSKVTVSGVSGFSDWFAGNESAVPVELSAFTVE